MVKKILWRIFSMCTTLAGVMVLTFIFMHFAPGNPFSDQKELSEEALNTLKHYYHLDRPVMEQFILYIKSCLHGDFGPSFSYGERPVFSLIKQGFPITLILGLQAFFLALILGYTFGIFGALRKTQTTDIFFLSLIVLGMSAPSFIVASLSQYFFAVKWPLLPLSRWGSFAHTVLPSIALAILPATFIAKLVRTNTLEALQEDYVRLAHAKGLNMRQILFKHVLKNACLPVVSYLGPLFASIITGSFVIEHLFHIPGIGRLFVVSVMNRDYPLIMGITTFYAALLLLSVFIVDLLYQFLDPRIKEKGAL